MSSRSNNQLEPAVPRGIENEMLEVRRAFSAAFKATVAAVMALVVTTGIAILVVAFKPDTSLSAKLLIARFIQVSFGMTIGSACVFFGVLLIWLGISATVSASAAAEAPAVTSKINVSTASPGIVVALAGVTLITLSLYRPIGFSEQLIETPIITPQVPAGV